MWFKKRRDAAVYAHEHHGYELPCQMKLLDEAYNKCRIISDKDRRKLMKATKLTSNYVSWGVLRNHWKSPETKKWKMWKITKNRLKKRPVFTFFFAENSDFSDIFYVKNRIFNPYFSLKIPIFRYFLRWKSKFKKKKAGNMDFSPKKFPFLSIFCWKTWFFYRFSKIKIPIFWLFLDGNPDFSELFRK